VARFALHARVRALGVPDARRADGASLCCVAWQQLEASVAALNAALTHSAQQLATLTATALPVGSDAEQRASAQALGRLAAVGVNAEARAAREPVTMHDMVDFSFNGFLKAMTDGGHGHLLVDFLNALVLAQDAADVLVVSEDERARRAKHVAMAVAHILQAHNEQWRWAYGFLYQFVLRTVTMSATALTMEAANMPGAPTYQGVRAWMGAHVAALKSVQIVLREDSELLVEYDNVGIYTERTSRAGAAVEHRRPVVTSMEAFHLLGADAGATLLQKDTQHAPMSWRPPGELPLNFADVRTTTSIPTWPGWVPPEGKQTQAELLVGEVRGAAYEALDRFSDGFATRLAPPPDGPWTDPLVERRAAHQEASASDEPASTRTVECPFCGEMWGPRKIVCDSCDFRPLSAAAKSRLASHAPTLFKAVAAARRRYFTKTRMYQAVPGGEPQDMGWADAPPPPEEGVENVEVVRDLLWCIFTNPNSRENIRYVIEEIGKLAKVRGFVPPHEVVREWLYVGSNGGALPWDVFFQDVDRDAPGVAEQVVKPHFLRMFFRMDLGHEDAVYVRMLCTLSWALGGKHLAHLHGFSSEGGRKLLQKGSDLHKAYDWMMRVQRPAMLRGFVREYYQSSPGDKDVDGFLVWLRSHPEDETFTALAKFWVLDIVPAYATFHNGMRENNYTAYAAGRKALLPLLFARNNRNYGRYALRDIGINDFRVTPEVRAEIELFLTYKGEGFGWRLEESNRNIKMAMTGGSRDQFDFATMARDSMVTARATLFRELGLTERETRDRSLLDLSKDVTDMEEWLWDKRVLQPCAQRPFLDLNGEPMAIQSFDVLVDTGKAALALAVEDVRAGKHFDEWRFPASKDAVRLSVEERDKGVVATDGAVHRTDLMKDLQTELEQLRQQLQQQQAAAACAVADPAAAAATAAAATAAAASGAAHGAAA
jgi:hypothetical protein